jgi:Mn-dependent DtxR family transcriptional regulator
MHTSPFINNIKPEHRASAIRIMNILSRNENGKATSEELCDILHNTLDSSYVLNTLNHLKRILLVDKTSDDYYVLTNFGKSKLSEFYMTNRAR